MKTDLLILSKLNDHDRVADTFKLAIEYAHPDIENLTVDYDGQRLSITCDGDVIYQNRVYATANMLVRQSTDKHENKVDFARILNNAADIMDRSNPGWRDVIKNNPAPFVSIVVEEPKTDKEHFFKWHE